jgi:hypothetical protein
MSSSVAVETISPTGAEVDLTVGSEVRTDMAFVVRSRKSVRGLCTEFNRHSEARPVCA